ncbi:hypothetical protein M3O96_03930 [Aquiflexum sp. TKW24L]|uniref:hypothetical protein n=1 Tax=Aquiflexum sp. TKW24L TaxID=2942212 RepID=UPI0020C0B2E6|nr:hypothetical protein [Aquiflexum sp. TKW24L]MCL6258221.1 hypothetical protein [Aquiflexum sp. TKW24L]
MIKSNLSTGRYLSFSLLIEVLSGVIGLMLVYYFILRLPKVTVPGKSLFNKMVHWTVCLLVSAVVVYLRLSIGAITDKWDLLITGISAFMIGLIVTSLWAKMRVRSTNTGSE